MKNWGNWSFSELSEVINKAKNEGLRQISIDQEHTDWQNDQEVNEWLKSMNLSFENKMERTIIYLNHY